MKIKLVLMSALVAVPLLTMSANTSAEEPVLLTENQMDTVTAGGTALAQALATAVGGVAATLTTAVAAVLIVNTQLFQTTVINQDLSVSTAVSQSSS